MKVCLLYWFSFRLFTPRCATQGYLNNPSATATAITPDGWFKTGDIAVSDADGFITIIDRRKELIKYKVSALRAARL